MAQFKRIPLPHIKIAAAKMAEAVRPEKIILFGSYAYGRPNADSDVDFLLVVPQNTRKDRHEVYLKASKALDPHVFPCDIVVRSKRDLPWRIEGGDYFLQDILEKGRVLYER
jgi:predicted nucleotidyltransferase